MKQIPRCWHLCADKQFGNAGDVQYKSGDALTQIQFLLNVL